jgi:rubrerythrin
MKFKEINEAAFLDPFPGITPNKKLSKREILRALRLSIAAEQEAVHLYESFADAIDNKKIKKVMQDVANEEKVHIGEFQGLLNEFDKDEKELIQKGIDEIDEI